MISKETAAITGKGFKVRVPKNQMVDQESSQALRAMLTPIDPANGYTILEESDTSFGIVSRCSVKMLPNVPVTKSQLGVMVRQATLERMVRKRASPESSGASRQRPGYQVIWTYVYRTLEDHIGNNRVCSSLWFDHELPEKLAPLPLGGENIGHGITFAWNPHYSGFSGVSADTASKREYVSQLRPIVRALGPVVNALSSGLNAVVAGKISEAEFRAENADSKSRIRRIEETVREFPLPPFECRRADQPLQNVTANLSNIELAFSDTGMTKWDPGTRLHIALDQIAAAEDSLAQFQHETAKWR